MSLAGNDGLLRFHVARSVQDVEVCLRAAGAHAGLSVELGPDRTSGDSTAEGGAAPALCGWVYTGNSFGTPTGRMDIAELRLAAAASGGAEVLVLPVPVQQPNRFARPWIYHEIRVRKPLLWSAFVTALRRQLAPDAPGTPSAPSQ